MATLHGTETCEVLQYKYVKTKIGWGPYTHSFQVVQSTIGCNDLDSFKIDNFMFIYQMVLH